MWIEAINIIIYALSIKWINSIANCECAKGWRRNFMHFYFSLGIVFEFSLLLGMNRFLNWPMAVIGIVYGLVTLNYIKEMKSRLCECASRALQPWFLWWTLAQTAWTLMQVATG